MKEYLAEVTYGTIEELENFKHTFQNELVEIQKEYYDFNINRDSKGVAVSLNFIEATVKLKPLPDDMPEEMKQRIIKLFQEYTKQNKRFI